MPRSIRWAITSVSVAEVRVCPLASSSARSSAWFSMIPLWTRARRPVQSMCGWAFSAVGLPWVAQRVCPMAAAWPVGASAVSSASLATESVPPAARARHTRVVDHHGDPGRVVAPVLELVQRAQEQGDGVGLAGDADDAAHGDPGYLGLPGSLQPPGLRPDLPQGGLDDAGELGRHGVGLRLRRASTMTRTMGSVPLGRRSTRPSWPSSASALTTASHTSVAPARRSGWGMGTLTRRCGTRSTRPAARSASEPSARAHQVGQRDAGEDAVARGRERAEDDVARLLAARG